MDCAVPRRRSLHKVSQQFMLLFLYTEFLGVSSCAMERARAWGTPQNAGFAPRRAQRVLRLAQQTAKLYSRGLSQPQSFARNR